MSFWHAIVVSSNPFNFVNAHSVHQLVWCSHCKECTLAKLHGLLITTMASPNDIHSSRDLAEKETILTSTLSHKMSPTKQTTEPKLLILVSFFSGEDTSSTGISYYIFILWEVCRSIFIEPPCILLMSFHSFNSGQLKKHCLKLIYLQ